MGKFQNFKRKFIHVEIIVTIAAFCCLMTSPLKTEYIYQRVANKYNASSQTISQCENSSHTSLDDKVSQESTRITMLMDVALFLPASLMGIVLTSLGDKIGRKKAMVAPLVGQILGTLVFSLVIKYTLPIYVLYVYCFITGISGYLMTLLMQASAYLSDVTTKEKRAMRMLILEMSLGIGGGLGGILGGFWVSSSGFFQPFLGTSIFTFVSLMLLMLLPEPSEVDKLTENISEDEKVLKNDDFQQNKKNKFDFIFAIKRVYTSEISKCGKCNLNEAFVQDDSVGKCFHGGGLRKGRVWKIWFYLVIYNGIMAATYALMSLQTLYVVAKPLCFNKLDVGVQMATKFAFTAFSPLLVFIYKKVFRLSNDMVILMSLILTITTLLLLAFATKAWMVYFAMAISGLSMPGKPFTQAQISKLVSETEHGAAFALLSCTEILTSLASTVSFLLVYKATLGFYRGFAYILATSMLIAPIFLVIIIIARRKFEKKEEEEQLLIS